MYVGLGAVLAAAGTVGWSGFAILCLYALALFLLLGAAWYVLLPASPRCRTCGFSSGRGWFEMRPQTCCRFRSLVECVLGARAAILHGVSRPLAFASTDRRCDHRDAGTDCLRCARAGDPERTRPAELCGGLAHDGLRGRCRAGGSRRRSVYRVAAPWPSAHRQGSPRVCCRSGRGHRRGRHCARYDLSVSERASPFPRRCTWRGGSPGDRILDHLSPDRRAHRPCIGDGDRKSRLCDKSAAFIVPNALGVQEAAYAMLAPLFGVGAEFGLAVSLLKRARDIAVGVPHIAHLAGGRRPACAQRRHRARRIDHRRPTGRGSAPPAASPHRNTARPALW